MLCPGLFVEDAKRSPPLVSASSLQTVLLTGQSTWSSRFSRVLSCNKVALRRCATLCISRLVSQSKGYRRLAATVALLLASARKCRVAGRSTGPSSSPIRRSPSAAVSATRAAGSGSSAPSAAPPSPVMSLVPSTASGRPLPSPSAFVPSSGRTTRPSSSTAGLTSTRSKNTWLSSFFRWAGAAL